MADQSTQSIELKKGKLFRDKAIKDYLAKDYKKYNKQIIDLEKKILTDSEQPKFTGEELKKKTIFIWIKH